MKRKNTAGSLSSPTLKGRGFSLQLDKMTIEQLIDKWIPESKRQQPEFKSDMDAFLKEEYCQCEEPDREMGYPYCFTCHRDAEASRLDEIDARNEERDTKNTK